MSLASLLGFVEASHTQESLVQGVHVLACGCVGLPARQFWRGSQEAPGVIADSLSMQEAPRAATNERHP